MRIALVLPGFSRSNADWAIPALLNLARQLAVRHDIHIFSQRYPAAGLYQFEGLTHHALGGGQKFGFHSARIWLQCVQAIVQQHRHTPFDLLHAFWADEAGFSAVLAGVALNRPVVISLAGGELTCLPAINYGAQRFLVRRVITHLALKRATHVTAGSAYQLALCHSRGVPATKTSLAPLGVDTTRFRVSPTVRPPEPALVQVASLLPVKNQQLLLEVLWSVKKALPAIQLHVAGEGPEENALRRYSRHLQLGDAIKWHGHVPYPAMAKFYPQAKIYLQSSLHEAQGMAVLEAMACGLPVVGTPVGILPEVAARPATFDQDQLATQIVALLTSPASYGQEQQQARQRVEEQFSLQKTTQNFLNIYKELYTKPDCHRSGP